MEDKYKDLEAQSTFSIKNKDGIRVVFNKGDVLESEVYLNEYDMDELLEAMAYGKFTILDETADPNEEPDIDKMHKNMQLMDKITLLGELEHLRRHCIRSAHVVDDEVKKFYYQVKAKQLRDLRRKIQWMWLYTDHLDWCIVKSASRLKQLNEEIIKSDMDTFSEIESIADELLGNALEEDFSGCQSCIEDKEDIDTE